MENKITYNLFKNSKNNNISANINAVKNEFNKNVQVYSVYASFMKGDDFKDPEKALSKLTEYISTITYSYYSGNGGNGSDIFATEVSRLNALVTSSITNLTAYGDANTLKSDIQSISSATGLSYKQIYDKINGNDVSTNTESSEIIEDNENNPFVIAEKQIRISGQTSFDSDNNIALDYNASENSNAVSFYALEAQNELNNKINTEETVSGTIEDKQGLTVPKTVVGSKTDINTRIVKAFSKGASQNVESDYIVEKMHSKKHIADTVPLLFNFPKWGVNDFIRERTLFQKQVDSISGDRGWFYFKIFFHFNTEYGLLGGIMDKSVNVPIKNTNTAFKYLAINRNIYKQEHLVDRIDALIRFVRILSYINSNAPWFFKEIKGLDKANNIYTSDFSKEKSIEITCQPDAVDMRLNAIMDLYKYAAYDNINCKEILPENLRKFDMTVMVFHTPLKYYQTSVISKSVGTCDNNPVFPAKTMSKTSFEDLSLKDMEGDLHGGNYRSDISTQHVGNYTNTMSFEMFEFKDCSFSVDTLGNMMQGTLNNEKPGNLGNNSIKINYNRCFRGSMNEWFDYLHTDAGALYGVDDENIDDNRDFQNARMEAMERAITNVQFYDPKQSQYKELISASEAVANNAMLTVDESIAFGNLYTGPNGEQYVKNHVDYNKTTVSKDNQKEVNGDYFTTKLQMLKTGTVINTDTTAKYSPNIHGLSPMVVSRSYEPSTRNTFGNTVVSKYYKEKLNQLINGTAAGNIYDYALDTSSNYYKDKIAELKGKNLGNISKYYSTPNTAVLGDYTPRYYKNKLLKLHNGTIKGNITEYNTKPGSQYFQDKLDAIKGKLKRSNIQLGDVYLDSNYVKNGITEYGALSNKLEDNSKYSAKYNTLGNHAQNYNKYGLYEGKDYRAYGWIPTKYRFSNEDWLTQSNKGYQYISTINIKNIESDTYLKLMEQWDGYTRYNSNTKALLSGLFKSLSEMCKSVNYKDIWKSLSTNALGSLKNIVNNTSGVGVFK